MNDQSLPDLGLIYRYVPPDNAALPPLLLLHGTGGDENDSFRSPAVSRRGRR